MEKTNVMRILDQKKIAYTPHEYSPDITEGILIADILSEPRERVFKTLVTEAPNRHYYVFVIPVEQTLDLKAAARVVGEKSVAMLKQKELLPLTGYIHGGCSPVGMKKLFKTVFHLTARDFDSIYVSAGRVGKQVCVNANDIAALIGAQFAEIIV